MSITTKSAFKNLCFGARALISDLELASSLHRNASAADKSGRTSVGSGVLDNQFTLRRKSILILHGLSDSRRLTCGLVNFAQRGPSRSALLARAGQFLQLSDGNF